MAKVYDNWFCYTVYHKNEAEKDDALSFLRLWQEYEIRKLRVEYRNVAKHNDRVHTEKMEHSEYPYKTWMKFNIETVDD